MYVIPGKTKTSHDSRRRVRECKATAKGELPLMNLGTTIIWCGTQVQGREDKEALGGTDSQQAVLGAGKDRSWMLGAED